MVEGEAVKIFVIYVATCLSKSSIFTSGKSITFGGKHCVHLSLYFRSLKRACDTHVCSIAGPVIHSYSSYNAHVGRCAGFIYAINVVSDDDTGVAL